MKSTSLTHIALVACCTMSGCASTDPTAHTDKERSESESAFPVQGPSGRVIDRVAIPGSKYAPSTTSVVIPIGQIFVPIITSRSPGYELPPYFIYEIQLQDEARSKVRVAAYGNIPNGTCVDILTKEPMPQATVFPNGTAALRSSTLCK
jgi:hypothetical protein